MKKTTKKLLWIFIPICAALVAIIGLVILISLVIIIGLVFLLLFPDFHLWQDATCTTPKTCYICSATEGEPAGHNYESVVTEPTFEGYGYTTYTCTHCGDHYEDNYIDPIKLPYDAGTLVFCANGVAYLIGEDQQLVEAYTGWETETYDDDKVPWQVHRFDIISVVIEDGVSPESTDCWFDECRNLERVRIGNAVTTIGSHAFSYCTSLTSITIPDGVTTIGEGAFSFCTGLTAVTIPDSVTTIGTYAFAGCTSLTTVTFGNNSQLTTIGDGAFYECNELQYNVYDNAKYLGSDENPYLALIENTRIDITSCTIHSNTRVIAGGAFDGCDSLTSITIPSSVTTIGEHAFSGCTSLTSITIPDSVTTIGDGAFSACWSLTSITIPDSVTSIGQSAFFHCTSLTSITIPDSETTIGDYAFSACWSLTSITFEGTVAEWNAVSKGTMWNFQLPATEVICSDGVVKL